MASIRAGTISALDLEANRVEWTLQVSEGSDEREAESAMGIAATRDGGLVFTGDIVTDEVVVVDADRREIKKRIPVGHQVHAIDIGPHGHWVAVAGRHPDYEWLSQTTFIDARELEKVETIAPALGNVSNKAGIEVEVTLIGDELWAREQPGEIQFRVELNTHAGDLMDIDLARQAELRADGEPVTTDCAWQPGSESSHHRSGTLTCAAPRAPERSIELELGDIGVPSREFTWTAPEA